jgi:hypothetical protein
MDSDHDSLFLELIPIGLMHAFPKSWASDQDYDHWLLEQANRFLGLEPRDASDRHVKHQVNGAKTSNPFSDRTILPKQVKFRGYFEQ